MEDDMDSRWIVFNKKTVPYNETNRAKIYTFLLLQAGDQKVLVAGPDDIKTETHKGLFSLAKELNPNFIIIGGGKALAGKIQSWEVEIAKLKTPENLRKQICKILKLDGDQ